MTTAPKRRYAKRLPREQRREQLLDAALGLIAREGWAAATFTRIAAEADIAKSVVYGMWDDQDTLLHDLMSREQQRAFTLAEAAITAGAGSADPVTALRTGLTVFLEGVAEQPDTWRLVFAPATGTPPAVQDAVLAGRERWRRALEPIVTEQLAAVGVTVTDAELTAHLVRGNAEYLARLVLEDPEHFSIARIAALLGGTS